MDQTISVTSTPTACISAKRNWEAAMAGFEQEFKDAEASKHERADNPPSEAFDSSEASDNAESSESSEVDDMLNAAEDSLKFEDELRDCLATARKWR